MLQEKVSTAVLSTTAKARAREARKEAKKLASSGVGSDTALERLASIGTQYSATSEPAAKGADGEVPMEEEKEQQKRRKVRARICLCTAHLSALHLRKFRSRPHLCWPIPPG
jgi:hypothetical protein